MNTTSLIPVSDKAAWNCVDDLIISICKWKGRNFELMYQDCLSIAYQPVNDKPFSESIYLNNAKKFENLKKFHGIDVRFGNGDYVELLKTLNCELVNQKPVIVYCDTYYIPWDNHYGKYSTYHAFIIVGVGQDHYICTDAFYGKTNIKISFNDLEAGFSGRFATFEEVSEEVVGSIDYSGLMIDAIKKLYSSENGYDTFESISALTQQLFTESTIIETRKYLPDLMRSNLVRNLEGISRGRKQFYYYLKFISTMTKRQELLEIGEKYIELSRMWENLRLLFMKSVITNKLVNPITHLNKIISIEQELANKITDFCERNKSTLTAQVFSTQTINPASHYMYVPKKQYTFINLEDHYNNKGFSALVESNDNADFDGTGQYFLTQDLPENRDWIIGEMKFVFPKIDGFDNVSCRGQMISFTPKIYSNIMLLASAEWSNPAVDLLLIYEDHSRERLPINVCEWLLNKPFGKEKVAWTGRAALQRHEEINHANIFAHNLELSSTKKLSAIVLPDCPNLHLFSLTLLE